MNVLVQIMVTEVMIIVLFGVIVLAAMILFDD